MNLKTILITFSCIAGLLIVITFYVIFYGGGGTYVVSSDLGSDAGIFATSTATQAGGTASSTTSSSLSSAESPIAWTQGNETLSVINASVSGSQLTLGVQVTMDSVAECVPLTLRMIADEQGDLSPPITSQFTFPDTGTCNGTPGETYSAQPIVFTLNDPTTFPIILTTGGTANALFEVIQNPDDSLSVQLPPSAD
jgi:hypothetical protein